MQDIRRHRCLCNSCAFTIIGILIILLSSKSNEWTSECSHYFSPLQNWPVEAYYNVYRSVIISSNCCCLLVSRNCSQICNNAFIAIECSAKLPAAQQYPCEQYFSARLFHLLFLLHKKSRSLKCCCCGCTFNRYDVSRIIDFHRRNRWALEEMRFFFSKMCQEIRLIDRPMMDRLVSHHCWGCYCCQSVPALCPLSRLGGKAMQKMREWACVCEDWRQSEKLANRWPPSDSQITVEAKWSDWNACLANAQALKNWTGLSYKSYWSPFIGVSFDGQEKTAEAVTAAPNWFSHVAPITAIKKSATCVLRYWLFCDFCFFLVFPFQFEPSIECYAFGRSATGLDHHYTSREKFSWASKRIHRELIDWRTTYIVPARSARRSLFASD